MHVLKNQEYKKGSSYTFIRSLKNGDHFGEVAILKQQPRSMNIRVKSEKCTVYKIDKRTFNKILPSIKLGDLKMDYGQEKSERKKTPKRIIGLK